MLRRLYTIKYRTHKELNIEMYSSDFYLKSHIQKPFISK